MNDDIVHKLARLVVLCFVLLGCALAYSFVTGYQGRKDLVESQRAGCARGKLDRAANARGWRAAETARLSSLSRELDITYAAAEAMLVVKPHAVDHSDLVAARLYNDIAFGLEKRSRIDCLKEFPEAGLIP